MFRTNMAATCLSVLVRLHTTTQNSIRQSNEEGIPGGFQVWHHKPVASPPCTHKVAHSPLSAMPTHLQYVCRDTPYTPHRGCIHIRQDNDTKKFRNTPLLKHFWLQSDLYLPCELRIIFASFLFSIALAVTWLNLQWDTDNQLLNQLPLCMLLHTVQTYVYVYTYVQGSNSDSSFRLICLSTNCGLV